ncbi:hypothetical protein FOA52_002844 [Chlamydomonas sp. UWO 241]|nr:hypothetical protein FOA52_002844 [Chlamydomonas sp. UWO 241]
MPQRMPMCACMSNYFLHAVILTSQSDYFEGRLGEDSSRFKPDETEGSGGSGSRIAFEIVEVMEHEADVEAMDALLRAMYGATTATDVLVLLRAARLADRFLVSKPVAQLLASCLAVVPADAITDDAVVLALDERSASLATPIPLELIGKCRVYVQTVFRNVSDVVTQPALLARFCALPHAAVVAWAQSDSLQVHSENEVVYLLSAWVYAQEAAGCPCSAEHLEQLVRSVRVADCGPSYLQMIVPALDWFESGLAHLGKFAVVQAFRNAGVQRFTMPDNVPKAWSAKPRAKLATCEAVLEFQVGAEKLKVLGAMGTNLDSVFINGFWMKGDLECAKSETTPTKLTLECYIHVDAAKMTETVSWPKHASVTYADTVEVGKAKAIGPGYSVSDVRQSWGYPDILDASAASVAALVAPHLEGGQLKGKITFSDVDLLFCD